MSSSQNKIHKSLLQSGLHSDLTITTLGRSFKVHKAIVCTQSKVLAAMSEAGFKESSTGVLALENDDDIAVERMVTFLYTSDYDNEVSELAYGMKSEVGTNLMQDTLVYSLANKYDMRGLGHLAEISFRETADQQLWTIEDDFPAIAAMVFGTTPDTDRGLRDAVSQICAERIDTVLGSDAWTEILAGNGALSLAILRVARGNARKTIKACKAERCLLYRVRDHLQFLLNETNGELSQIEG